MCRAVKGSACKSVVSLSCYNLQCFSWISEGSNETLEFSIFFVARKNKIFDVSN